MSEPAVEKEETNKEEKLNGTRVNKECRTLFLESKRPYTFCMIVFDNPDDDGYIGIGFSKVCHPDKWDALEGIKMAKRKAVSHVMKQIYHTEDHIYVQYVLDILKDGLATLEEGN